jgi:hypothetical protein
MKQLFLALSLFSFLMPKQGFAQIQSGTSMIGGAVDARFSQNNSSAAVRGNYTKFINPHLGFGAGLSAAITNFSSVSFYGLNFGATGIYVLNPSNKAPFYAGLGLSGGTNTALDLNGQIFRTSLLLSNLAVGNLFFLNKNVALNTSLDWYRLSAKGSGLSYNTDRLNLTVSLTPFLHDGLLNEIVLEEGQSLFDANRISAKGQIGYYDMTTEYPDSVSHIRKDIEASFFLTKGLEIGAALTDDYISPFAAFYLPMQHRVGILGELRYQKVLSKKTLENSTLIPSLGAAYFLSKNIAVVGKLSYYPSRLSAFNGTGISLNLKYFLK